MRRISPSRTPGARSCPGRRQPPQACVGHAGPEEIRQARGQLVIVDEHRRAVARRALAPSSRNRKSGETRMPCSASAIPCSNDSPSRRAALTSAAYRATSAGVTGRRNARRVRLVRIRVAQLGTWWPGRCAADEDALRALGRRRSRLLVGAADLEVAHARVVRGPAAPCAPPRSAGAASRSLRVSGRAAA